MQKERGLGSLEEDTGAGIFVWSWLGLGRKGGVNMQGAVWRSLGPHPSDVAGDWHLWGETAEKNSQPHSNRSLQAWECSFLL